MYTFPRTEEFASELARINNLPDYAKWAFKPGMLFGSYAQWWAEKERETPHEGLDFALYEDTGGIERYLLPSAKIPAAFEGRVAKVGRDIIGQTIYSGLGIYYGEYELYAIYAHTSARVKEGDRIGKLDEIAALAEHEGIPSHLHITFAWIPKTLDYKKLNWKTISRREVFLIDPTDMIVIQ